MLKNIPYFEIYPLEQQKRIKTVLIDIIKETFIYTADSDYVNARFLSLNGQYRPFFWPALHSIEKYLKANLLMYGVSVKDNKFGHNIVFMASELGKHSKILENLRLEPNTAHKMLEENSLWGEYDVDSFLKSIEKFGDPSNRYNYYGSSYEASFLLKLDQVVYALRKNFIGDEPLHNINKNDTLKHFAYDQNMCFAPSSYVHESMYGKFGLGISQSTLQVALNGMYGHSHVFEKWVTANMHFGKKETHKIKGK